MIIPASDISPRAAFGLMITLVVVAVGPVAAADNVEVNFSGPPGVELFIDDQSMGSFPLAGPLTLTPGDYQLTCRQRGFVPFEETLTITQEDQQQYVQVRLHRYDRSTAWTSSLLFAGLGQHYLNRPVRGWIFNLAEAGGLVAAIMGEAARNNYRDEYIVLMDRYNEAIDSSDLARYRSEADAAYDNMETAKQLRDTGLLVAVSAVALSVLDAVLFFPGVDAGPGSAPPVVGEVGEGWRDSAGGTEWLTSVHAGLVFKF